MKKLLMGAAMVAALGGCTQSMWASSSKDFVFIDGREFRVNWVLTGDNQYDVLVNTDYFGKNNDPFYDVELSNKAAKTIATKFCASKDSTIIGNEGWSTAMTIRVVRVKCVIPNTVAAPGQAAPSQPVTVNVTASPVITVNSPPPIILDPLGVASQKPLPPQAAVAAPAEAAPTGQKSEAPKAE